MKWHEARTLEEFDSLPLKEREKMPGYLEGRWLVAASFLDQREHEAINVSANSPYQWVSKKTLKTGENDG